MTIEGFLERIGTHRFNGWCIDRDDPTRHLSIQIMLDGTTVIACIAAKHRPDLENAGVGGGDHAFAADFETPLNLADVDRIKACVVNGEGRVIELPRLASSVKTRSAEPVTPVRQGLVPRRLPRGILHIGMEKTGSTSLQRFLGLNRDRLLEHRILVPRCLAPHADTMLLNHISLTTYALDIGNDSEPLRAQSGCVGPDQVKAHRAATMMSLAREITQDGGGCDTLLLTNEHCQSRLFLPEEIGRLRNFLLSFCEDVRVVLYIRPQHEVALSAYGTILKNGAIDVPILPPPPNQVADPALDQRRMRFFDYDATVTRWEAAFGADHIEVRLFSRDVISDFLAMLDLRAADFVPLASRQNMGLDGAGERMLIAMNRALALLGSPERERVRGLLLQALEATHAGRGTLPSRTEAQAFQMRFADSNETLRQRRFPDRPHLFDLDFSAYAETRTVQPPTVEEMARTMVDVLRYIRTSMAAQPG